MKLIHHYYFSTIFISSNIFTHYLLLFHFFIISLFNLIIHYNFILFHPFLSSIFYIYNYIQIIEEKWANASHLHYFINIVNYYIIQIHISNSYHLAISPIYGLPYNYPKLSKSINNMLSILINLISLLLNKFCQAYRSTHK